MASGRHGRRNFGNGVDLKIDEDFTGIKNIYEAARKATTKHLRFGWLNGKKYPASHKNKGMYIASIAEIQEYGTTNIPARPYAMTSFLKMTTKAIPDIEEYFRCVCKGYYDVSILNKIAADGKKTFADTVLAQGFSALSPITVRIKGHDFQLDDTGYLLQNYDVKVYKTKFDKVKD